MLVLTRRIGESIIIGNGIKLTIVSVGPGRVKIGIDAPPSVRIDREEIHARILQEKASDVLEAVAAGNGSSLADGATAVVASGDTGVLREAEEIPDQAPPATPTPAPVQRLSQFRPRKPR
jgi:carbon storage regulator